MNDRTIHDVVVVGGGPTGLAAAIALAQAGARAALVARRVPYSDNRTSALLAGSIEFLEALEVWPNCRDQAAELRVMRLVDDTGRLIRAPEVRFSCEEIGLDVFGYNIENRVLVAALEQHAAALANLTRYDDEATAVGIEGETVTLQVGSGRSLSARLAIGADGRHSLCREAAGIGVQRRELGQAALTFNVSHSRAHRNISTEFHTARGPCVFVPLPGNRSSVVWVSTPKEAERLMALNDDELSAAAEIQSKSILGRLQVEAGRHMFALSIEQPRQFAKARIALVGEAAHVLPPIGAQGLNMGLSRCRRYCRYRAGGIVLRWRSRFARSAGAIRPRHGGRTSSAAPSPSISQTGRCSARFLPMQSLRAAGLHLIGSFGPLRRLAMREGLAPSWRTARTNRTTTRTPAARFE